MTTPKEVRTAAHPREPRDTTKDRRPREAELPAPGAGRTEGPGHGAEPHTHSHRLDGHKLSPSAGGDRVVLQPPEGTWTCGREGGTAASRRTGPTQALRNPTRALPSPLPALARRPSPQPGAGDGAMKAPGRVHRNPTLQARPEELSHLLGDHCAQQRPAGPARGSAPEVPHLPGRGGGPSFSNRLVPSVVSPPKGQPWEGSAAHDLFHSRAQTGRPEVQTSRRCPSFEKHINVTPSPKCSMRNIPVWILGNHQPLRGEAGKDSLGAALLWSDSGSLYRPHRGFQQPRH